MSGIRITCMFDAVSFSPMVVIAAFALFGNNAVPNRFSSRFSASRTNGPRLPSWAKASTHSPFGEKSHTAAHTPKQGPSLPRSQRGFVPPVKSLLFRHAFIYIHFPVLCDPSLSATVLSQAFFHYVFQLLAQMAHVCFHEQKCVHIRLCSKDRTQGLTRRNTGRFGRGRYYYPRSVPHVSETLRGQMSERQTLPLLGLGRVCS